MSSYAQTNLELYAQLRRLGWADAELVRVREAYALAMRLFSGCFRPSGKTFLAHLVGTASILADLGATPAVVTGGLLHAAYSHGEFGTSARGPSRGKRGRIRRAVGGEVEDLVARYAAMPWGGEHLAGVLDGRGSNGGPDRQVLLMRLANELEDHLDLAAHHCEDAPSRRQWIERYGTLCVRAAGALGAPALARALEEVFAETRAADLPAYWRAPFPERDARRPSFLLDGPASILLPPASHALRPSVAVRRVLRSWGRRVRHALRRLIAADGATANGATR